MMMNAHPRWIWSVVILLAMVHQDFWWWNDRSLVLGFLPIGLAYQALFSVAAALVWAAACRWAWPTHLEEWADAEETSHSVDSR